MKSKIIILSIFALFLGMTACVVDDGNYEYKDINDVVISGIETKYTITMLDTLRITPSLAGSIGPINEQDYDFLWTLYEGLNSPQRFSVPDTLAKSRNLEIAVTHIPDNYRLSFHVKDKNTGVRYRHQFEVQIMSEFQRGLLILSDLDGNAAVSMVSITGDVFPNLYYNINGEHAGTKPLAIDMMGRAPLDYVAVICDDDRGGVFASSVSFKQMMEYRDIFYNSPAVIKPQGFHTLRSYGAVSDYQEFVNQSFIVNDGKLYFKDLNYNVTTPEGTVTVETKFYDPYSGDYEIASERFRMVSNLHFCNKYKRYMYIPNLNQPNLFPVVAEPESPHFCPANVGMELVWGRHSPSPRNVVLVHSLHRNDDGKIVYFKWRANFPSAGRIEPQGKIVLPDEWAIHQAKHFAGNVRQDYIYYGVGNTVYLYDAVAHQERVIYQFPGNVTVDKLLYREELLTIERMWVATSQGDSGMCGSIHEMEVGPGGNLILLESFENVGGKIVDMCWKN